MTAFDHIGDDAALYALGLLDERERDAIDRHAAHCDACARELAAASDDVARMAEAGEHRRMPSEVVPLRRATVPARRPMWFPSAALAVAAAFVIGVLPSAYMWERDRSIRAAITANTQAMDRLASTPHRTIAFTGMKPGTDAHVMYGMDGSWYVVLVRGASRALSLVWMHDGRMTPLGSAEPYGNVATVYLPASHRMDRLALMDGERMVAEAQLAY